LELTQEIKQYTLKEQQRHGFSSLVQFLRVSPKTLENGFSKCERMKRGTYQRNGYRGEIRVPRPISQVSRDFTEEMVVGSLSRSLFLCLADTHKGARERKKKRDGEREKELCKIAFNLV
jgi:hypothetical protein